VWRESLPNLKVIFETRVTALGDKSVFSTPRKRRKTRAQKQKGKGRRSYKKGLDFEKKAYPLLARKGYKVTKARVRSKKREEFDGVATDRRGHMHAVECKNTKQKVNVAVVKNLKKKVSGNRLLHGGIIVSKKGFTKEAEQEAKKDGIKTIKYKQKRKKKRDFSSKTPVT
jgi:hypothetical protein